MIIYLSLFGAYITMITCLKGPSVPQLVPRYRLITNNNSYKIHQVHIKDQNKVIQVKNHYIFEDYKTKIFNELPDYNKGKLRFQDFFSEDNDDEGLEKLTYICHKSPKIQKH